MNRLVAIYDARGEMEAQVIKGLLESQGIPCYFRSSAAPSVHVFTVDGLGMVKIMVAKQDADRAREVIADHRESI